MIKSSISQEGYPKKIIIDKDTLCALTIPQVDSVNKAFIDLDECQTLQDSLYSHIKSYVILTNNQAQVIRNQDNELVYRGKIIEQKDVIIEADAKEAEKYKLKIALLKIQRVVYPIIGTAIGVATMIVIKNIQK